MINNSNNNDSTNNSDNNDISSNSNETRFENLQAIISNMNFNSNNNDSNNHYNENENSNNNFNLDFETIMKMKRAMDIFNSNKKYAKIIKRWSNTQVGEGASLLRK